VNHQVLKHAIKGEVDSLQLQAEAWGPDRILTWAFETFGPFVAISSAFGAEGMAVIDMAARLRGADFRLFTLDTEFLFPETYELMDRIQQKYGVEIEKVYPVYSPQKQEQLCGPALWARDPDRCCNLRKVEPLRQKLSELAAWITSIRRNQTSARAGAQKIEWDAKFGLMKINPIVDWSKQQVWRYLHARDVPYNPLHDRGYPSIGCTHCTRSVNPGEDERAGRWAGFTKNECGLHVIGSAPQD
jgi:phosphoadenosine phosphosulfate reductase